jgi:ectoine hydroxylase-related dioxygenase (phytanoyl-CoA dioxygenase family)
MPELSDDPKQWRQDLDDHGVCLVADALDGSQLEVVRERLYDAAAEDVDEGRGYVYDNGDANQRVWALLKRGQEFVDLARNEIALDLVRHVVGSTFLLSNISANITGPGGGRMALHADQGYVLPPFPPEALAANAMWCVDDFDADVGATEMVPGSHQRDHGPGDAAPDDSVATVPITAPAGTLCVMDGRVWHQTGENVTTDRQRAGIFAYYVRPFLRTQENWWRSLPAD